ncbi:KAP family P-loop NTPase fold protein [Neisseria elongata]|uniref:KAP family P-loop NTPase fold protein n=1 Tax=Neisseria elongata TaxID=495 RepID=UPI00195C9545|nr:P-loop NTPase fold protein [Neisseria elongata]MBM7064459.1 NTPase [Neisseria elongata]
METQTLENPTFDTQDEFNRRPIAENIIRLLTSDIDLSPMVIDGGWGTGKTEFCQKLIRLMQQQHLDYRPVYIDAFRSDHSGEPLLALLAEIIKTCTPEDTGEQPSEQRKNITRKVAKAAGFVMKTVAKAAVGHVLKQNLEDLEKGMSQIINDEKEAKNVAATVADSATTLASHSIDATIEALLEEQIEAEKNLETLKACLTELAAEKPIILFIDELDRCRPDYAVDMLEVIKHVFDVENVKIVLVTNTKQLCAAINHRYGMEVDAQKYLDKFLKYSFALPDKVVARFEEERALAAVEHFKQLIRKSHICNELQGLIYESPENISFINFIGDMIARHDISLRETERFVRFLEIYHSLSQGLNINKSVPQVILLRITGVFIFCFHSDLIASINKNRTDAKDFARLFNVQSWPDTPPIESYGFNCADIIAVMLIKHSKIEDARFQEWEDKEYWQTYIDHHFFKNKYIVSQKRGIYGVLSILKETFQVLSLEQTPQ